MEIEHASLQECVHNMKEEELVKNQPSTCKAEPAEENLTTEANSDGMDKKSHEHMIEEGGAVKTEEELTSINSMMSTVMNVGQINGVDTDSTKASPKIASKSLTVSRTGRRNQEVKEERSSFICPLCNKNCLSQHQLTMHIRQHNTDSGGTDHSCSICGKALSSASSLDRHMLVHSGERPYTCVVCHQTFTTNGNMHRHMKIHEKDASSIPTPSSSPLNKPRRLSAKKRIRLEEDGEQADERSNKKMMLMQKAENLGSVKSEEELFHCPICFKTFICKYGLESHMETHPETTLRCNICCITFRTHRGLLRHNSSIHKQLPTDPAGRPFIQSNPSIPLGFGDLAFIDFSCSKFPQIAQVWCETNLRRCASKFHKFVCDVCNKAFPLQQSLDLHRSSHKNIANTNTEPQESNTDAVTNTPKEPIPQVDASSSDGKNGFMESLGLQNSYLAKPEKSGEQIQQEVLDSIRFIRIETPSTNLPQKTSSLGFSLLEPVSLQGMKKNAALSLLSLQPLHGVVSGGMLVPISSQTAVELTDIEQILKIAASPHMALSLLPTVQASTLQLDPKQIASLKPKPLITPRSSMGTSTPPPPIMSAQKASSGNISPSLPPQTGQQQRGAGRSSASSSSSNSSSPTKWEASQTTSDIMLYDAATEKIKQEEFDSKELKNQTTKQKATKTEYPCRFCKEVFSFLGGLQAHMRHHLGASPYQCNACSYAAPDKATLIRHMRTHSGERPYICRICHYPFTVKANCERHLRKKHMKNTRKEIEKNIEYVANSSSASSAFGGATLDLLDTSGVAPTSCRYCGEDLKNYRALQIHLRTHNGCQRKPFECRQCGAAFLAKRNCILHLLKQHPDVPEREIEERIKCLLPVGDATLYANQSALTPNGPVKSLIPPVNQDQPLDFSSRSQKVNVSDDKTEGMTYTLADECSMEPIDLSLPKGPAKKRIKTEVVPVLNHQEVKKEQTSPKTENNSGILALSISNLPSALSSDLTKPITRLKPLLPKPSITVEMAPLASIAKIISSVSGPPMLMEADANGVSSMEFNTFIDKRGLLGTMQNGSPPDNLKRKCKKRQFQEEICDLKIASGGGGGIDLESSGEFPSVEKMLATTDSNTFSTYLQPQQMVPVKEEKEMLPISEEMMEGKEEKPKKSLQNKGKKNAYSNSVQKMTCPFCPRLFPWASSLQRHMLTHTGQKPYPCPHCESFFSTKSNCERHLLRKHGVSNRTLQNNASRAKTKTDEGSQGSTGTSESISDTEPAVAGDTTDASSDILKQEENSSPPEQETEQTRQSAIEQTDSNKDPNTTQAAEDTPEKIEKDDDDFEIDKNLDVNSHSTLEAELSLDEQFQPKLPETLAEPAGQQDEFPHTCATCKMTFRNAATYSVHQKTHVQEVQLEDEEKEGQQQPTESVQTPQASPRKETEQEADIKASESEESNSCVESGAEEEKIERDEMSDDEEDDDASSELRGLEEGSEQTGGKPEKRKKVCIVCSKRFWSLQDLTRHMRSHTGERPYKCQTCCRTFTLKHSLVRHQRVHQKPTDERGNDEAEMNEETDDTGLLEEIEVSCPSEKEGDATSPVQAESEGERADLPEEDENDRQIVENDEEKQNPVDTDVKDSSPRDPQPEAEQEIRVDEPLIHVASDLESAKTSIQCTTAQETAEKENH